MVNKVSDIFQKILNVITQYMVLADRIMTMSPALHYSPIVVSEYPCPETPPVNIVHIVPAALYITSSSTRHS